MLFKYSIITATGKKEEVAIEASSKDEAKRKLRRKGLFIIKEIKNSNSLFFSSKNKKFNIKFFADRLAPLLKANIPLEKALAIIESGYSVEQDINMIVFFRRGLHEGKRFSSLIKEQGQHFPLLFSALIEVGEEAGCLSEVLEELRRFLKESIEFKNFIITSSIYPIIVISVTLLVIIMLFTVFIPQFASIFNDLGKEMPLLTSIMLHVGIFFKSVWWLWPISFLTIIIGYKALKNKISYKFYKAKILLMIPLVKDIITSIEVSRFMRTLAVMLHNQVHLLVAIRISKKVINNMVIFNELKDVEICLQKGDRLSNILRQNKFIDNSNIAMIKVAEESGDLSSMLLGIAIEMEEVTRIKIKRILTFLEPAVILFLAFVVLMVVLAIFLAIMEMNSIK